MQHENNTDTNKRTIGKCPLLPDPLDPAKMIAIVPRGSYNFTLSGRLRVEKSDGSVVVNDENFQLPSDWYQIVEEPC